MLHYSYYLQGLHYLDTPLFPHFGSLDFTRDKTIVSISLKWLVRSCVYPLFVPARPRRRKEGGL